MADYPAKGTGLAKLLFSDLAAALLAGSMVTPIVSGVDRALAVSASSGRSVWGVFFASLADYAKRPVTYLTGPQFYYVLAIYGGTYSAANIVDTLCEQKNKDPAAIKWTATSVVNTTTCILKDQAFAKLFGASVPTAIPPGAYAAWLTRDFLSMGVFFTLPPLVGEKISSFTGSEESGYYAAQIGLPLALQTITAPLHLLGYDIYNNPNGTVADRIRFLRKDYWKNVTLRMVRMAPPWSFGTIGNKEFRKRFREGLNLPETSPRMVYHMSG